MVGGEHGQGHLDVVMEPLGKHGANGPVGHPGGQDAVLPRATLPAEEAAGDLASGIEPFFVVHCERQKVHVLGAGPVGHDRGRQHDGVAVAHSDRAVGLERQLAGFDNHGLAAKLYLDGGGDCS